MPSWLVHLLGLIESNPALVSLIVPNLLRSLADQIEKNPQAMTDALKKIAPPPTPTLPAA